MVSQIMKIFIFIVTVNMVCGRTVLSKDDPEQYGVSFYDPQTGASLPGDLVPGSDHNDGNATNQLGLATFGNALSCVCQGFSCSCCAGIKISALHLDKKACLKFTYDPNALSIRLAVMWNDRVIFGKDVSAKNPPPVCISIPGVPLLKFCIRFSDLSLEKKNLHTCINFEAKIAFQRILNLRFKCVDIGADGFHWNKAAFAYALPSTPETAAANTYHEVVLEEVDLLPGPVQPLISSNAAEQYEVSFYDPKTGSSLMGEFVTITEYYNSNATDMPGLATLGGSGLSCECKDFSCSCCAGIKVNALHLDKKACLKFTYDPKGLSIRVGVLWNDREVFGKEVSARNPPPICMSLPDVPLLKFCIRFSDLSLVNRNLHTCINFEAKIAFKRIVSLRFKCVEIGADGFHWNLQSYGNAIPFIPETAAANTYHEVVLDQADLLPGLVEPSISNNGAEQYEVSFYDPKTGSSLMGEFVTVAEYDNSNATDMPGLATFGGSGLSCDCKDFSCSCCAGIKISALHLDKKACLKFTYDPKALGIRLGVMWNDREIFGKDVSAKNPPPVCISIPGVPLLKFCIRFNDLSLEKKNLHTCINFEAKIAFKRIVNLRFKCVDIGADGFHWNKAAFAYAVSSKPMTEELVPYEVVILEEANL